MRNFIAVTLAFTLFSGAGHAAVFNPKSTVLPNGLQVVVVENHMAPVVTHMMWIKAGAADEQHGVSGIAHYLEHLMFKGTAKIPNGEYSSRIAQLGGSENAFTSWDYTAYFATVAKQYLPEIMEMEADRLTHLQIKKELAAPELAVVLDERRQRVDDDPYAPLMQQMGAALFPHHPYGIPVIGWKDEIEKFTVDDAKAFYSKWYQPANTFLVISGDVNPEEVFALAKSKFGGLPKTPPILRARSVDPVFTGNSTIVLENPHVKETTVVRTYKVPSSRLNTAYSYDIQMLEQLLDGSDASFLPKRLIQEKKLVTSVSVNYQGDTYDAGQISFTLVPKPDVKVEAALVALDEALNDFLKKPISADELKIAATGLQRQAVLARDSVMGPAHTIGAALATGQTLEEIEAWPERIAAVKAEDVIKTLKALIVSPSVTGVLKPIAGINPKDVEPIAPPAPAGGAIR